MGFRELGIQPCYDSRRDDKEAEKMVTCENELEQEVLDYYVHKLSHLRINRSKGMAPHKPLLLLAIIELIEYGKNTG